MPVRSRGAAFAAMLAVLALPGIAAAASPEPQAVDLQGMRARADALRSKAQEAVLPLAPGQTRILEAVVMETRGRVQWQADEQAPWKNAEVDDILEPGATIRTGGNSKLFLRVGHNASLLVDRMTVVTLPEFVHDGEMLRTRVVLQRGIVDVKVDRVGPTNDVEVLTPSTTLAVRGTGLSVRYGGFDGTQVAGARTNEIFAIEVRYFVSRYAYYMSGAAISSENHPNPVVTSLFETFGPPRILSGLLDHGIDPSRMDDTFERSPIDADRRADDADPVIPPGEGGLSCPDDVYLVFKAGDFDGAGQCAALAMQICENLFAVFNAYDDRMIDSFGGEPGLGFDFEGLNGLFLEIDEICAGLDGDEHDLAEIARAVSAYCENQFPNRPQRVETCTTNFRQAVRHVTRR
jgi:hypothetical protein